MTNLEDHRPLFRTPQEVTQRKVNEALGLIDSMNRDGNISSLAFIILAREGEHIMSTAGDEDANVVDMITLMELHRNAVIIANGYDETGSLEDEQPDLFGQGL